MSKYPIQSNLYLTQWKGSRAKAGKARRQHNKCTTVAIPQTPEQLQQTSIVSIGLLYSAQNLSRNFYGDRPPAQLQQFQSLPTISKAVVQIKPTQSLPDMQPLMEDADAMELESTGNFEQVQEQMPIMLESQVQPQVQSQVQPPEPTVLVATNSDGSARSTTIPESAWTQESNNDFLTYQEILELYGTWTPPPSPKPAESDQFIEPAQPVQALPTLPTLPTAAAVSLPLEVDTTAPSISQPKPSPNFKLIIANMLERMSGMSAAPAEAETAPSRTASPMQVEPAVAPSTALVVGSLASDVGDAPLSISQSKLPDFKPTIMHVLAVPEHMEMVLGLLSSVSWLRLYAVCHDFRNAIIVCDPIWPRFKIESFDGVDLRNSKSFPVVSVCGGESCYGGSSTAQFVPAHGRICGNAADIGLSCGYFGTDKPAQRRFEDGDEQTSSGPDKTLQKAMAYMSDSCFHKTSDRLLTDGYKKQRSDYDAGDGVAAIEFPAAEFGNDAQLDEFLRKYSGVTGKMSTHNYAKKRIPVTEIFKGVSIKVELVYHNASMVEDPAKVKQMQLVQPRKGVYGPATKAKNNAKDMTNFGIDDYKVSFQLRDFEGTTPNMDHAPRTLYSSDLTLRFKVATTADHLPANYYISRRLMCYRFTVTGKAATEKFHLKDGSIDTGATLSYVFLSQPFMHYSSLEMALNGKFDVSAKERKIDRANAGYSAALTRATNNYNKLRDEVERKRQQGLEDDPEDQRNLRFLAAKKRKFMDAWTDQVGKRSLPERVRAPKDTGDELVSYGVAGLGMADFVSPLHN